jgi:hypothetical protein
MKTDGPLGSSFRDPSGFLFRSGDRLYRQVSAEYAPHLKLLEDSGLYDDLVGKGLLVVHEDADLALSPDGRAARILAPELVSFISYPYEWCFSQLKDAAVATLRIQKRALAKGLTLKDASAYNIQFMGGRPTLIDTLSFEPYLEGAPWVAYRQFCQHFLAPLALMAKGDVRLGALLRTGIDGVPLDLASRLLPWKTRFDPGLLMHVHAHARSQKKHEGTNRSAKGTKVSRNQLLGILDSLRGAVKKLEWKPGGTEWGDYYDDTNYSAEAAGLKGEMVGAMLDQTGDGSVWDLGANDGTFSRLAAERGRMTVAADIDPTAVEKNWRTVRKQGPGNMLPLLMDLTNPSPSLGWAHDERDSLLGRGPAGTILALALIHHLAISNNVPLDRLAAFFAAAGEHLIIEFVPKNDSQVERLLATREDVFPDYHPEGFESAFAGYFEMVEKKPIQGSERILYLLRTVKSP